MLDSAISESAVEAGAGFAWMPEAPRKTSLDWRTVDSALRAIRRSRAVLDAEEMHWLREAEALQIWRPLGMVSALDYLERALGYAPRTAQDRLRVARALGTLPGLTAALAGDDLSFSAVRELTRVATPATESVWVAAAAGKNLRQIEELVADHHPGDRPDDPPDPRARLHVVRLELAAETFAVLRQTRQVLNDEHGTNLSDDGFVAALCGAVLDDASASEPSGRARYQVAVTVCQRCRRGWQEGSGVQVAIEPAAVDRALCDAQHIGSVDGEAPERAYQDVPPAVARLVWRRDGGRCRVPGCRSARGLEIHHLVHRADGGGHDALNLALLCSACHLAHHRGALTITGTAEQIEVRRAGEVASEGHDTIVAGMQPSNRGAHLGARMQATDAVGEAGSPGTALPAREVPWTAASASSRLDAAEENTRRAATSRARAAEPPGVVTGERTSQRTVTPDARVGAVNKLDAAILRTEAKAALTGLGWKPALAGAAVASAMATGRADMTLEQLIFEALRCCPVPRA